MTTKYTKKFYDRQVRMSVQSAQGVIPHLLSVYKPSSVVDVGCGLGSWLSVFKEHGVSDIMGLDGAYVRKDQMLISAATEFAATDLSRPVILPRRYDLAVSMEVAEHLPSHRAESFIQDLVKLSDVVLFSAAIPFQGGTGHVNENWLEYWARLFMQNGYRVSDFLRPLIWNDSNIGSWYRQNLLVFYNEKNQDLHGLFSMKSDSGFPLSLIHPEFFMWCCTRHQPHLSRMYVRDCEYFRGVVSSFQQGTPLPENNPMYGREYDKDVFRKERIKYRIFRTKSNIVRYFSKILSKKEK